jgi:hypothetical protein
MQGGDEVLATLQPDREVGEKFKEGDQCANHDEALLGKAARQR